MPVEDELFATIPRIREWAASKPTVKRLWVFGSRLRGTQKPASDLDICIEIDPLSTDEEAQIVWTDEKEGWLRELALLTPYKIHLEMYGTPKVSEYIENCSMLIYERVSGTNENDGACS